jgi:hypothetical protein
MWGITKLGLAALAAVVGFFAYWYLVPRSNSFGMFEGNEVNGARLGLSFGATILGVVLGSFYRQLRKMQSENKETIDDIGAFLSQMFRSVDMWLGLAGSPIVYALLLQSTSGMNLPGLLVVALENGFCCLILINQFVASKEGAKTAAGAGS